eukprot:TRINITY_DN11296_c0_g1_i1.p1 TRINITY_DN11296_c0_g1~~TRINITY_DN11296_c0_g1_i1.p1  ORF type:complete len:477 (-),score=63.23 TRINITY_DN11296_c0_g1_i1:81-1511(-)
MKVTLLLATVWALVASPVRAAINTYPYIAWSDPIKAGVCGEITLAAQTSTVGSKISCVLQDDGIKAYSFPVGIFEIDEQLLLPDKISITGAKGPNDMSNPTATPDWTEQTLFLATRGVTDFKMNFCHAKDMVNTRVGFVLGSYVTVRNVSYQGIDTIRPNDNGGLCGGGAFETKGCAENDCKASSVNNGGSDGHGSVDVTIDNVRINDFHFAEDEAKVGANVEGNYDCKTEQWLNECCFCKPNGIRSSQVGLWVPQTRNAEGTRNLFVNDFVVMSTQADSINLHGYVRKALVQNSYVANSGDDQYALWGAASEPEEVVFKDCIGVNPGILRPNWYGVCVATYGLRSVTFENITCRTPTLANPIPAPGTDSTRIANSMFVFHTSFGGRYPDGNSVGVKGFYFEDLDGNAYTPEQGSMGEPKPGKMAWSRSSENVVAPFYFPEHVSEPVNVHVIAPSDASSTQAEAQAAAHGERIEFI